MCGICGVVAGVGGDLGIDLAGLERMRDVLSHRGPDDAGVYWGAGVGDAGVGLGHRRLSIIDRTAAGHQPMVTEDGRFVIVYNGELYNDDAVRSALSAEGVGFVSRCDTETVLRAVSQWGTAAAGRLRGMYAFGLWDRVTRRLVLARDGFGMKPLYLAADRDRVVFGSEIPAVLKHPGVSARPDLVSVSAYLTTIRTTMDDRTLFADVRSVRPGEWVVVDCSGATPMVSTEFPGQPVDLDGETEGVGDAIASSVRAHLRSEVPWCSLLSGGLDSTVIARIAREEAGTLRTYVSGSPGAGDGLADDFAFAEEAAAAIGSVHTRVPVSQEDFVADWPAMVGRLGVPLSTPNEVAIYAVARRLRADGHVVTLSGEGADEIFAGYELPMMTAWGHITSEPDATGAEDGVAALRSAAWLLPSQKSLFVRPEFWEAVDGDAFLLASYGRLMEASRAEAFALGETGSLGRLRGFLGVQRRVNLSGLLQRLDTATMLASVEGRTPFADAGVLAAAGRLRMEELFRPGEPPQTKIALREAFSGAVPASICARPKRSFPLPFQGWLSGLAPRCLENAFVREVYSEEAIAFVCADPARHWNLAWPMVNLAIWSEAWLPAGAGV